MNRGAPFAALLLAGCTVGPRYHPPVHAPVALKQVEPASTAIAPDAAWWHAFNDPILNGLVEKALSGGPDIREALARVQEARALFEDRQLDALPRVTVDATYTRGKEQVPGITTDRVDVEQADLGFDASWEIDLFGRVRHGIEAAWAEAQAAQDDLRGARVTLAAEVVRRYLDLRGAQVLRRVTLENVETQRETLPLTQVRFDEGRGDPADVQSALAQLRSTEARLPALDTQVEQAANRIAVLTGERPGTLDIPAPDPAQSPGLHDVALPIGDASTFLTRRPDVLAAERRLAAETARTGIATADLFPRLRITGFFGLLAGDIDGLFGGGAKAWEATPSLTWPGLDMGGALARLRAQQAHEDAVAAAYDRTVLVAIENLQDALTSYHDRLIQFSRQDDALAAAKRAADLSRIRYREGSVDFLRVLDAERTRLDAQSALVQTQTAVNTDAVSVYKALGGAGD